MQPSEERLGDEYLQQVLIIFMTSEEKDHYLRSKQAKDSYKSFEMFFPEIQNLIMPEIVPWYGGWACGLIAQGLWVQIMHGPQ